MWKNTADVVDLQKLSDFALISNKDPDEITLADDIKSLCVHPYYMFGIKYDGEILPCCSMIYEKDVLPPMYLKDCSLAEYWQSPELLKFFQSIKEKRFTGSCRKCVATMA